jgi:heat shock protein HspQ
MGNTRPERLQELYKQAAAEKDNDKRLELLLEANALQEERNQEPIRRPESK